MSLKGALTIVPSQGNIVVSYFTALGNAKGKYIVCGWPLLGRELSLHVYQSSEWRMNINHESEERFTPDDHEDLDMVQPRSARRIDTNFHFWKLVLSLQYLLHHNWLDFQFVLNTRLLYRMFVPFFSKRSERSLVRRKGGGGKGAGGGGKSGSGGGTGAGRSSPISSSGSSKSATSYGAGGGKVTTIPSGQLFAGRTSGGGTRSEVFGNRYVVLRQCLYSLLILFFSFSGSMEVVTQELQEEVWLDVDFHSYSGPWPGEAWLALGPRLICTIQRSVILLFSPLRA